MSRCASFKIDIKTTSLLLLLAIVFSPKLWAAPTLSWKDAKELALQHNPRLKSGSLTTQSAAAAHRQSYSGYLPKVSLKANQSKNKAEALGRANRQTEKSISATASVNIFDGFSTTNTVGRSKAGLSEAQQTELLLAAEVRRDLRIAFAEYQAETEKLKILERTLERRKQNEKLVSLKYENGSEARWNLRKAKADTARAQSQVVEARFSVDTALESLNLAIYGDHEKGDTTRLLPLDIPAIPEMPGSEFISLHPRIQKLRFAEERLERGRSMARSAFLPSVDLSASKSRADTLPSGTARSRTDTTVYGISATWNIFNGAADALAVQQANLNLESASIDRLREERRLQAELNEAKRSLEGALDRIPSATALRQAAEERLSTVTTQYRSGLRGYLEWEQSESLLGEAEQSEISVKQNAWNALAKFEFTLALGLEAP
jgi:outer membrane protein TolC